MALWLYRYFNQDGLLMNHNSNLATIALLLFLASIAILVWTADPGVVDGWAKLFTAHLPK
jgi:hypothetical protein